MRDGFCARSRKASESVPEGSVRMSDTEMAQKTPADVHGLGANQYQYNMIDASLQAVIVRRSKEAPAP